MRTLYINTLLGASERLFQDSLEFKAFSKGINLFLSPDMPSFAHICHLIFNTVPFRSHRPGGGQGDSLADNLSAARRVGTGDMNQISSTATELGLRLEVIQAE